MNAVSIKSIACHTPATSYANDDPQFSAITDLPDHWYRFWGVESRGFYDESLGENELAAACDASKRAIQGAELVPDDIDMVIATSSFTYMHGATTCGTLPAKRLAPRLSQGIIQELNLSRSRGIDQQADCISFLVGMQMAAGFIRQGAVKNVLICCSEFLSPGMDLTRKEGTLFGDGCAAAVLSVSESEADLQGSMLQSSAEHYMVATAQWRKAERPDAVPHGHQLRPYFTLTSDGPETMRTFIPFVVPRMVNGLYEKVGMSAEDIDYFVFHQPSKVLVDAWAHGSGAHADQYLYTMQEQGVMVSVSMPFTFYRALQQKQIGPGDRVVFAGAATGWSYGAQIWKLDNPCVC